MSDCVLKIEKLTNGYEVEVLDPDISAANRKPKSNTPYKDPWRCYAFTSEVEVIAFITKALPKLKSEANEEESMFDAFANEEAEENE